MTRYSTALGELIANLQSLEFALRAFLVNREIHRGASFNIDLTSLKVGDQVAVNDFTNFDSLGTCIDKFNAVVNPKDSGLAVDASVVELRNALSHGRISAASPTSNLHLLKFAKPTGPAVTVTLSEALTPSWFRAKRDWVATQVRLVQKASSVFGYEK